MSFNLPHYRQTSNIKRTLTGNKSVDDPDVVGASPVGAATRLDGKHLSLGIWCGLYLRFAVYHYGVWCRVWYLYRQMQSFLCNHKAIRTQFRRGWLRKFTFAQYKCDVKTIKWWLGLYKYCILITPGEFLFYPLLINPYRSIASTHWYCS